MKWYASFLQDAALIPLACITVVIHTCTDDCFLLKNKITLYIHMYTCTLPYIFEHTNEYNNNMNGVMENWKVKMHYHMDSLASLMMSVKVRLVRE